MKLSIRKLMTLLLLFTCSIGAWAQGNNEPSLSDGSVSSLLLKHNFGETATVTFYLYSPTIFEENEWRDLMKNDINKLVSSGSVQEMNEYATVVAHVVPATGYWTNEALLYARMVSDESIVQNQPLVNPQTRGASINGSIEVKLIPLALDENRNDGAGWYYFEMGEMFDPSVYESCILDGYVLPKFDLSGDALKSNDGKSFTFTVEDNWITELSIDVALTDETAFYYNASAQGPTKLTNTSIVVKRFDSNKNGYDDVFTINGADEVAKHVTSGVIAKTGYSLIEDKAIDAGDYALKLNAVTASQSAGSANNNDPVATGIFMNSRNVDFVINQKPLEVKVTAKNKVYDGKTDAELTTTVETGITGEALTVSGLTGKFNDKNVGKGKTVEVEGTVKAEAGNNKTKVTNYDFSYEESPKADITAKPLTVTAADKSKVFGENDPVLTYTNEGLLDGDAITGALTRAAGENVGEYAITQGTVSAGNNYSIAFTPGKLTIMAKTIKDDPDATKGEGAITIVLDPTEYTYDKTEKKPAVTVKDGQTTVAASEYKVAYKDNINAGTASVTITDSEGGNYTVSGTKTFTIKKAALTITADAKSKKAGEADPELTYKTEGLVKGDELTGALTRKTGEDVGEYDITQGTLEASDNYEVTFKGAKLTITSASFTEDDVTAKDYEGTYDGKAHTITVTAPKSATIEYGKEKDTYGLTEAPTFTNVGEYTVYYQVTMANTNPVTGSKKVVIKQAELTITADAKTKVEGEADPELTYTTKGLVEGEKLEGALTREAGEKAGEYAITQGTLKASDNYMVTYVGAKLTITAKPAPPTETTYRVIVDQTVGGEVIATKTEKLKAGEQVNMVIKIDEGYHLESLSAAKQKGGNVNIGVTKDKDGKEYNYFLMPADNVFVTATFAKDEIPDNKKQNIFIFRAKYGEVVSHVLYADPEKPDKVNLVVRKKKGYENCVLDELYVYNDKFQPIRIFEYNDPEEGLIYFFFMSGEKAYVYNTFKGTNGIVDESNPLPPDYNLYLFSNILDSDIVKNFLQTNNGSKTVKLAMDRLANILATFNEKGELQVNKGEEDMLMGLINLLTGWVIKIDFEGTIKALAPQLLELVGSKTRGADSDGTIISGAYYRVLEDTNLEFLLESSVGPLLIKSISVMAPEDVDPTAIYSIHTDDADADIYDLRGRKVDSTNLRKGVYIKNGRKVVIK